VFSLHDLMAEDPSNSLIQPFILRLASTKSSINLNLQDSTQ